jgi:hypothetical protein
VKGEIRNLELKRPGALAEGPKVPVDGRIVLAPREVGRAAGMRYKRFGRGYGPRQGRSQVENGCCLREGMARSLERHVRNSTSSGRARAVIHVVRWRRHLWAVSAQGER